MHPQPVRVHLFNSKRTCGGIRIVLKIKHSSLLSGKFEFHEEWLRDEPCDATTTGLSNSGDRCQLSPGNRGT